MQSAKTIGIVGGGQLGRMLTLAAKPLGFEVVVIDPSPNCPAAQVGAQQIAAAYDDGRAIELLAKVSDVITIEIEHTDTNALAAVAKAGTPVHPNPATVAMIKDKFAQKEFLRASGVAVGPYRAITDLASARVALEEYGGQMMLKTRYGGYDGRGNFVVTNPRQLTKITANFEEGQLYAEQLLPFKKELSVIVARDTHANSKFYPTVELIHQRSICLEVLAPANISPIAAKNALKLAKKTAPHLKGAGVFAIEMFLLKDDNVVVNEIAPRVHNSGHYTTEACATSQFEQHIRAIAGLPLGETHLVVPAASMVNILGTKNTEPNLNFAPGLAVPESHVHWYGKTPVKIDRKMGHVTSSGSSLRVASKRANDARKGIKV